MGILILMPYRQVGTATYDNFDGKKECRGELTQVYRNDPSMSREDAACTQIGRAILPPKRMQHSGGDWMKQKRLDSTRLDSTRQSY